MIDPDIPAAPPTPADRPAGVRLFADRRVAEAAVLGVMVIWAANFIVVKDAIAILPPVGFTMLRYGLASIALLAILRWSEGAVRLPRPDVVRILVLGGLGFGLYQILWTTGLTTIPAGDSALIIASTPVLVAVLAGIIGVDTLTPQKFAGAALSFLGVVVVIAAGVGISMSGSGVGSLLTLAAAACWASYTTFATPVLRRHSPLVLTTWATIGGTLVLIPLGVAQLAAPGALGPEQAAQLVPIVLAIVYSGVLAAAVANVVVFNGVRLLGPTRVITLQSFVPPMAVVLAFVFLQEPIRPAQVVGGLIIVLGVALTRRASVHPVAH
ncbi:MAG TPA: DMT family transporter [Candidatus Limnocylindrales bacterium]|nr:DMT family transporter [Candidatus Limnocylindrales bacterium]